MYRSPPPHRRSSGSGLKSPTADSMPKYMPHTGKRDERRALLRLAMRVLGFKKVEALRWWRTPSRFYGGKSPSDMVREGDAATVRDYLISVDFGTYI